MSLQGIKKQYEAVIGELDRVFSAFNAIEKDVMLSGDGKANKRASVREASTYPELRLELLEGLEELGKAERAQRLKETFERLGNPDIQGMYDRAIEAAVEGDMSAEEIEAFVGMLAKSGDTIGLNRLRREAATKGVVVPTGEVKKPVDYFSLAEKLRLNTSAGIREDTIAMDRTRFVGQLEYIDKNVG